MRVAGLQNVHAARHVSGHNITASLVEDGLWDARVSGAQGLPVSEDGVWS